jgi:hypothetical protein
MSAARGISAFHASRVLEAVAPVPPIQSFNPTVMSRPEGRSVVRLPEQLQLHHALKEIGWSGPIVEFNDAARPTSPLVPDPIMITRTGTILVGFGQWRLALIEGRHEIHCIEYVLSDDESLQFILTHHQIRRGWNDFVRIRLALTLKPHFQQRALDNMSAGGKLKGLANLPDVQRIDVRQEIADIAAVCSRNVGNVETILKIAHPGLIEAPGNGMLKINRAMKLCKLPNSEQFDEFDRYSEERATSKIIRRCLGQARKNEISLDAGSVLEALHNYKKLRSGSILARIVRNKRTVILVGQDLLAEINSQKELPLK